MTKIKHCKYCNSQIPDNTQICPYCGCGKIKHFDKLWVWAIIFLVVASIVISLAIIYPYPVTKTVSTTASVKTNINAAEKIKAIEDIEAAPKIKNAEDAKSTEDVMATKDATKDTMPKYDDGEYLVGKDILAGLYKVTLMNTNSKIGYVERAASADMSTILANITYTGDGYIKIKSTDAVVKLSGVVITPIHYTNLTPNIKNEVGSGTYLIGIDINPGTYKIEPTAGSGKAYYARLSSVSMDENDIIKYEFFKNTETITILPTDVAIHIQGAKLTLQK
jgi:hypothetical protein